MALTARSVRKVRQVPQVPLVPQAPMELTVQSDLKVPLALPALLDPRVRTEPTARLDLRVLLA